MKIHASGEDYLEAVLVLQKNHGAVRSIDVARRVGVSKASVSYAVSALREGGFLTVDSDYVLHLTETGRNVAEKIYERHQFFTEQFIAAGVDPEIAERDACRIEHAISQDTFEKIRDLQPFQTSSSYPGRTIQRRPPGSIQFPSFAPKVWIP